MKKILTLFFSMMMVFEGFSQTYYNWDFTTATSSTFPAGFVTWKLDNGTANTNDFSAGGQTLLNAAGWVLISAAQNGGSGVAVTTSDFNTSVACDRWLVTPDINVPAATPNVVLKWVASSGDANVPDQYEVRVSTTDSATTSFGAPIFSVSENAYNTTRVLPLAAYAGQRIRIAFHDNTTNGYLLFLNSISVVNLPTYAASISDVEIYEHNYINNPVNITGIFTNTGFDTLTNFTVNYSVNGGAPVTSPLTGQSLVPQQSYYYSHGTPFNPTTAGTYTIQVWFSGLNGSASNSDTVSTTIFYYPQVAGLVKNVVVEEMTGAGCPWCPGGALTLRDVYDTHPYVIPVAIHSADINDLGVTPADAMQITDGETVVSNLATGFPTAMTDRLYFFDNQSVATNVQTTDGQYGTYQGPSSTYLWDTLAAFRYVNATPVNVSLSVVSFDSTTSTNNLVVTVNANFLNALSQGTYNLNMYVVEDSVLTPAGNNGNGYTQDNGGYSGQSSSGSSELFGLATTLLDNGQPNEWAQNHVLRLMGGGPWGSTGIIPSAPATGTTYSKTYTVSVPNTWRYSKIFLVGLVQEYNTDVNKRTILNAARAQLITNPLGIKTTSEFNSLSIYPNPASSMATVQMDIKESGMVNISVVNAIGQTAIAGTDILLNAGSHSVNVPVGGLDAGLYFVKVSVNGEVNTIPLSVTSK